MSAHVGLVLDRREALAIAKALAARSDMSSDRDLVSVSERIDRFLVGRRMSVAHHRTVTGKVLHSLTSIRTGESGTTRCSLEFELDGRAVHALVDGAVTVRNVTALTREPALIRVHAGGHETEFVVPTKLPADWTAALPPGRKVRVTCGQGDRER